MPTHDPRLSLLLRRYDHDATHGKMEYFPAVRSLAGAAGSASIDESAQKEVRMLPSLSKYGGIPKFLVELGLGLHSPERVRMFAHTFDALCKTKSPRGVRRTPSGPELVFADPAGGLFAIPAFSSTEQQAAIFFGDRDDDRFAPLDRARRRPRALPSPRRAPPPS